MTQPDDAGPAYQPPPGAPPPPGADPPWQTADVARRLGNTVKALFALHLDLVKEEAERELRRLALVAALLGGSAAFGAVSMLNVAILVILGIERFTGLPALESVALGLAVYIVIILIFVSTVFLLLRRPFLPRSRVLVQRTVAAITHDNPDAPPVADA